jgi:hypothetical protein
MADFNIRSDSVDVEQIMTQIRARIQEKRGVDYTEEQVRELATVRLEKFLDPKNLRSDLLEQFRHSRPGLPELPKEPPPVEPPYVFDDETLFRSHRGPLRFIRRLLKPLLKLFFNPNTLNQVLHTQAQFNVDLLKRDQRRKIEMQGAIYQFDRTRAEWNVLYYEVLHNLVLETTRNGIELKNLKMRVEALASRLDFSERRVRALEGVVQYRPEIVRPRTTGPRDGQQRLPQGGRPKEEGDIPVEGEAAARPEPAGALPPDAAPASPGEAGSRRRRRRRRGRRGTGSVPGAVSGSPTDPSSDTSGDEDFEGGDEGDVSSDLQAGPDDSPIDEGEIRQDAGATPARSPERDAAAVPPNGSPAAGSGHDSPDGEPPARPSDPHAQ